MSSQFTNAFIISVLQENDRLKEDVKKLEDKIRRKKHNPNPELKKARKKHMSDSYLPGGFNFHRSMTYSNWERVARVDGDYTELEKYHKSQAGNKHAKSGGVWTEYCTAKAVKKK
jgi:hypothetical protein